jgi:hypothetical protein
MAVVDALVRGRPRGQLLTTLRLEVRRTFALLPSGEKDMLRLISAWERLHLAGKG